MAVQNVFIVGMEKCGTSALAEWMLSNGLVEDRVPNLKEPYLFANDEAHPPRIRTSDLPLLDASIAYAQDPATVNRLPEYDTRIVICLRNPFDRLWSAYKMRKVLGPQHEVAADYFAGANEARIVPDHFKGGGGALRYTHETHKKFFPRRSHAIIERYLDQELERIESGTFASRIEYELGFWLSRKQYPLASILANSFYYSPLRNVQQKYLPSDISVISVKQLDNADVRREFVEGVFEKSVDTTGIPQIFVGADIEINEPKPDFNDPQFDLLRACFRYDLAQLRDLIPNTRFGDRFLDNAELDRYMAAR